MHAVSPLSTKDENQEEMESFTIGNSTNTTYCDFADLSDGNLLENINFDDFFVGINNHVLPDLEMDTDMFPDFSLSGGEEESETNSVKINNISKLGANKNLKDDENKTGSTTSIVVTKREESGVVNNPSTKKDGGGKGRKSSSAQGKTRKVKVDWTPELHRRFMQAVEQLGVDKAVPSRILEIMGIDSLTRHNIASHLQKYRSHRKHLLAREAEAASWNQRRQVYGTVAAVATGAGKIEVSPWPTTLGFPPIPHINHFRPLHVWGHPSMDQSLMQRWPPPPLSWPLGAAPPIQDPSLWLSQHQRTPNAMFPGAPCFPQHLTTARFGCSPFMPPHGMFKAADHGIVPPAPGSFIDLHPSMETLDAAIGDVLSKPWLPLPLGLKAPALDSVMSELQRQGISNIPPSCD